MSAKLTSLQSRRAALRRKLQGLAAVSERQLDALVLTRTRITEIDIQSALLDRQIAAIIDESLNRVAIYHQQENAGAD